MLFSCCFALSLVHELPLPASAVVGGGGCCWRDVLGPESLLVPWKCQKCQEWSVFRRVWDGEGWASQAWIEDLGLGGKVGAWQRNPYLTGLINDVTVLFFTVYSSVFSILLLLSEALPSLQSYSQNRDWAGNMESKQNKYLFSCL